MERLGSNWRPVDHKSDTLTTIPPCHPNCSCSRVHPGMFAVLFLNAVSSTANHVQMLFRRDGAWWGPGKSRRLLASARHARRRGARPRSATTAAPWTVHLPTDFARNWLCSPNSGPVLSTTKNPTFSCRASPVMSRRILLSPTTSFRQRRYL